MRDKLQLRATPAVRFGGKFHRHTRRYDKLWVDVLDFVYRIFVCFTSCISAVKDLSTEYSLALLPSSFISLNITGFTCSIFEVNIRFIGLDSSNLRGRSLQINPRHASSTNSHNKKMYIKKNTFNIYYITNVSFYQTS